jgi:hypothetical protein
MRPPVAYLRECLRLDKRTGKLFWRVRPIEHFTSDRPFTPAEIRGAWQRWNTCYAGREVGTFSKGYLRFHLRSSGSHSPIAVHRAIYALVHGEWPPAQIDHWNGVTTDNRPDNLKSAGSSEQGQNAGMRSNNTSGFTGVCRNNGRWLARIQTNGKRITIGHFDDRAAADAAYRAAKATHHTYHPSVRA